VVQGERRTRKEKNSEEKKEVKMIKGK